MSSPKPKYTIQKLFEKVQKRSDDIEVLPNKNRTKTSPEGQSKGRGRGYGRSKNFIKQKNTRIYKARKYIYYPSAGAVIVEMDYTNKALTDDEIQAIQDLVENYGNFYTNPYLITGDQRQFHGQIYFPNLTIDALEDIYIQPVFIIPEEHVLEPTVLQGEGTTGFRTQDQNQDFPELYEFTHYWQKTPDDNHKGFYLQFHGNMGVFPDTDFAVDFEIWFQALNKKVWQEIQHYRG